MFVGVKKQFRLFFESLDPEFTKHLILKMEYTRFCPSGEQEVEEVLIQKAGKIPKTIYFIMQGTLGLYSFDGVERFMELRRSAVYGESYILYGIPSPYTLKYDPAHCRTKVVDAYKVDAGDFLNILKSYRCVYHTLKSEGIHKRRVYRIYKRKYIEKRQPSFLQKMKVVNEDQGKSNKSSIGIAVKPEIKLAEENNDQPKEAENPTERPLATEDRLLTTENMRLETGGRLDTQVPADQTNVFGLLSPDQVQLTLKDKDKKIEEEKETEKKSEDPQSTKKGPSDNLSPSQKAKKKLFNTKERKMMCHNDILENEYYWDSEEEYGNEDVFEKRQVIKDPVKTLKKIDDLKDELNIMSQSVDKVCDAIEKKLELIKLKIAN